MPKMPKVVIDTNLWISFLIGKSFANLKSLIVNQQIEIIISEQLITEIRIVTQRPKLTKYFSQQIGFLHLPIVCFHIVTRQCH